MPLSFVGSIPVGVANIGLTAGVAGLGTELAKLQADVTGLTAALVSQVQFTAGFPVNPAGVTATITGQLNPLSVAASFAAFPAASADIGLELGIKLGLVSAQVAAVAELVAPIELGLAAPGIAGWSYSGRADRFGTELQAATGRGFDRFGATVQVRGVVLATESFATWQAFSAGFETGASALAEALGDVLTFLGSKGGGQWNLGTARLFARLRLLLSELEGLQASLEAQIQVSLGLNLPDVTVLVNAGLAVDFDLALDNLVNVQVDLTAALGDLQLKIDALVSLIAELNAQLSAAGLALWTYSGAAGGFGSALRSAIASGIPGGSGAGATAYGLAFAGTPGALEDFGSIFAT